MPLEFTCPYCAGRTLVDDEYLGHTGPCFQCGKTVTVPHQPHDSPDQTAQKRQRDRRLWLSSALVVLAGIATGVVTLILVVVFIWPLLASARSVAHNASCSANLRAIAAALQQYHDKHGAYPPPFLPDANGKPAHSWRVLILPHLGEQALYERYRFDEPWDGPSNFALQTIMPAVYGCPADPSSSTRTDTSYLAVVGKRTAFPSAGGRKIIDIRDGLGNTLLVAECHESGIPWTAPRDMPVSALAQGVNAAQKVGVKSHHDRGAYVVLADGQVEFVGDNAPSDALEALSTVDGNENIDWPRLEATH